MTMVFPAETLTFVPETMEYRRYHLHERHVQKAIKGVTPGKMPKVRLISDGKTR